MKLNLGCGDNLLEGYTNVDLYDEKADVRADITELPFSNDSADRIVAYQVIEHLPYNKTQQFFEEIYRVLKSAGEAIIETPDIEVVARKILEEGLTDQWMFNLVGEYYRPQDKERYSDWEHNLNSIHRNPFTYERMARFAEAVGFSIERREQADFYPCEENLSVRLVK